MLGVMLPVWDFLQVYCSHSLSIPPRDWLFPSHRETGCFYVIRAKHLACCTWVCAAISHILMLVDSTDELFKVSGLFVCLLAAYLYLHTEPAAPLEAAAESSLPSLCSSCSSSVATSHSTVFGLSTHWWYIETSSTRITVVDLADLESTLLTASHTPPNISRSSYITPRTFHP